MPPHKFKTLKVKKKKNKSADFYNQARMRLLRCTNWICKSKAVPVHAWTFILVVNQTDAQNLFYNKFISCLYMFRASYAHRQEVKIVL